MLKKENCANGMEDLANESCHMLQVALEHAMQLASQ